MRGGQVKDRLAPLLMVSIRRSWGERKGKEGGGRKTANQTVCLGNLGNLGGNPQERNQKREGKIYMNPPRRGQDSRQKKETGRGDDWTPPKTHSVEKGKESGKKEKLSPLKQKGGEKEKKVKKKRLWHKNLSLK